VATPIEKLLTIEWNQIRRLLNSPWLSFDKLMAQMEAIFRSSTVWEKVHTFHFNIAGSPDTLYLYAFDDKDFFLCSSDNNVFYQPFVREIIDKYSLTFECLEKKYLSFSGRLLKTNLTPHLIQRCKLPQVLLVNLFHPEMYPTARLTLGISYIASFLRHNNYAQVTIIDCQLGKSIDYVIEHICKRTPEIVGLSVNFGQIDLMEYFLDQIANISAPKQQPIIILGNILPAMDANKILTKYPFTVVCQKEGELSLAELVKRFQDRSEWSKIPGICYKDIATEAIRRTPSKSLSLESLPPPALDTVNELFQHDGVITSEFSRGCHYNICSFCPRFHKGSTWRPLPVSSMVRQWKLFDKVFTYFNKPPHVFWADEDFIGYDHHRIDRFLTSINKLGLQISFDASCRIDQLYSESRNDTWHIKRGHLFRKCLESGLTRLFVGLESGSDEQLNRYKKGYSTNDMISALRYFSLLGVQLRFGFIFFDPLMKPSDLCENVDFVGRTDIVLKPKPEMTVEEIFALVKVSHNKPVNDIASIGAVFENVSYMISPLEMLVKCKYLIDLQANHKDVIIDDVDINFARVTTKYVSSEINLIYESCQKWVNFCFPIVYALKGLRKVSQGDTKSILTSAIKSHRRLSYFLIKSMVQIFELPDPGLVSKWESWHPTPHAISDVFSRCMTLMQIGKLDLALELLLSTYEELFRRQIDEVYEMSSKLPETKRLILESTYSNWVNTSVQHTSIARDK